MKIEKKYSFTLQDLSDKEKRNLEIYGLLKKKKIISRTELSRSTGINIVSISNYIKRYIDKKLALECGVDVSTGGRKPELVELDTKESFAIGIEAGKSAVKAVMADLAGKIISSASADYSDGKGPADKIVELISSLADKASYNLSGVRAVGIGTDNERAVPIAMEIEEKLGIEVFIGDPVSCAAVAEQSLGRSACPVLYIHSDLGSGVVVEEEGIIRYDSESRDRLRYLAPWGPSIALAGQASEAIKKGAATSMAPMGGSVTGSDVIAAAKNKDKVASIITERVGLQLGMRIAYLVNLFKPAALIVGGGLETAGSMIMGPIEKTVRRFARSGDFASVKIFPGSIGEGAVSIGALSLAVREVFLNA